MLNQLTEYSNSNGDVITVTRLELDAVYGQTDTNTGIYVPDDIQWSSAGYVSPTTNNSDTAYYTVYVNGEELINIIHIYETENSEKWFEALLVGRSENNIITDPGMTNTFYDVLVSLSKDNSDLIYESQNLNGGRSTAGGYTARYSSEADYQWSITNLNRDPSTRSSSTVKEWDYQFRTLHEISHNGGGHLATNMYSNNPIFRLEDGSFNVSEILKPEYDPENTYVDAAWQGGLDGLWEYYNLDNLDPESQEYVTNVKEFERAFDHFWGDGGIIDQIVDLTYADRGLTLNNAFIKGEITDPIQLDQMVELGYLKISDGQYYVNPRFYRSQAVKDQIELWEDKYLSNNIDLDGNPLTEKINIDGFNIGSTDPANIAIYLELVEQSNRTILEIEGAGVVGNQIGSIIGGHITSNPIGSVAASAVLATVGENIAEMIANNGLISTLPDGREYDILKNIDSELAANLKTSGIGAISSFLTAELFDVLGISGVAAEIGQTIFGSALNQVITNLANVDPQVQWNTGLENFNPTNLIAGYLGAKLASQIISFDTVGGQIGSSIGSSLGGIVGSAYIAPLFYGTATISSTVTIAGATTTISNTASLAFSWAGPAGIAIGAFVGFILGGLIGSIFGGTPRSGTDVEFDEQAGGFVTGESWSEYGGSIITSGSLAGSAAGQLNSILVKIGGKVVDFEGLSGGTYGTDKGELTYNGSGGNLTSTTAEIVLEHGILNTLDGIQIAGGDIFMKRALYGSLENILIDGSVVSEIQGEAITVVLGNMELAKDYQFYLENSTKINTLMEAEPQSEFTIGWAITIQRAKELGINKRHSSDWLGGFEGWVEVNDVDSVGNLNFNVNVDVNGHSERDVVLYGENSHRIYDTISYSSKDVIQGTSGNDTITITAGTLTGDLTHTINGIASDGSDFDIDIAASVYGGLGDDIIIGGDLGNDLFGGAGNDTITGGAKDDWIFGEAGDDILNTGGGSGDFVSGGSGNDIITGDSGSDWLSGDSGVDIIDGKRGDDILEGGASDGDTLFGGDGNDSYIFRAGDGHDVLEEIATAKSNSSITIADIDFEARYQGMSDGTLEREFGAGGWDYVPKASQEYIQDDVIAGGVDTLVLGPSIGLDDIVLRQDGNDLILEVHPGGTILPSPKDTMRMKDWFNEFQRVEYLEFSDGTRINIGSFVSFTTGTNEGENIFGTDGAEFVHGAGGDDNIWLLGGDDFGNGGDGNDFVSGGDGNDIVIGAKHNDSLQGNDGNDIITGDNGDDFLMGNAGNDILIGGTGNDILVGGTGDDVFKYNRGDGQDVVFDRYADGLWELVSTLDINGFNNDNNVYHNDYKWVTVGTYSYFIQDNDQDGTYNAGDELFIDENGTVGDYLFRFDYSENIGVNSVSRLLDTVPYVADGGTDRIEFAPGIELEDIQLQWNGDDLILGIGRPGAYIDSFASLTDTITLKEWAMNAGSIEEFGFFYSGPFDTTTISQWGGGTDFDDTISGSVGKDWITGNAGDDVIDGGSGDDFLHGNSGHDIISGGAGDDVIYGGSGNDILDGGEGKDVIIGGSGNDMVSFQSFELEIGITADLKYSINNTGMATGDKLYEIEGFMGSNYNDDLRGNAGRNLLQGASGDDTLNGDLGDDTYIFNRGDGNDIIAEGENIRTYIFNTDGTLNTSKYMYTDGTGNNNSQSPTATKYSVWEYDEKNSIYGEGDQHSGEVEYIYYTYEVHIEEIGVSGSGTNNIVYTAELSTLTSPISINPPYPIGGWQPGFGIELNGLSAYVDNVGTGDNGNDTLELGVDIALSDLSFVLSGTGNNDLVISIHDQSTRAISDTITIKNFTDDNKKIETLTFSDGFTVNIASLLINTDGVLGIADEDLIVGDGLANNLNGNEGNDVLSGFDGDDILNGGDGDDVLIGGVGGDSMDGGTGIDTVRYNGSQAGVDVDLIGTTGIGGDAAGDTLTNIENVSGSNFDDTIDGNASDNILHGLGGNDIISGAAGHDKIFGNDGNDTLYGDAGDDHLVGAKGADELHGGADADYLDGGEGIDTLYGEAGDDDLDGGAGADLLDGGAGNDSLIGGKGDDVLQGGIGDDQYLFYANDDNNQITDADGVNSILFGVDVTSDQIIFEKQGANLVIKVSGGTTEVEVVDYFAASGQTLLYDILVGGDAKGAFFKYIDDAFAVAPDNEDIIIDASYWHDGGQSKPIVTYDPSGITTDEFTLFNGTLDVIDHDENVTGYTKTDGSYGTVTVDGSGGFIYTPTDPDYNGTDSFSITVTDADGNETAILIPVTINAVNDIASDIIFTPVDSEYGLSIPENAPGWEIGTLSVTDPDDPFAAHTNNILSVVGDGTFEIVGNVLKVKDGIVLDYEAGATVDIQIRATDANDGSLVRTETLTFNIANESDDPAAFNYNLRVNEDAVAGVLVDTVVSVDATTASGYTDFVYTIIAGNIDGRFYLDATSTSDGTYEVKTNAGLDFEAVTNTYDLTVKVEATENSTQIILAVDAVHIDVDNVNEQPYDLKIKDTSNIEITSVNIQEDHNNTTVIAKVSASDPDGSSTSNGSLAYSLTDDANGTFKINPTTGDITLSGNVDYEDVLNRSYQITAVATDRFGDPSGLSTSTKNLTINIEDVNDNSPIFDATIYTAQTNENTPANTLLESVGATDAESVLVGEIEYHFTTESSADLTYSYSNDLWLKMELQTGKIYVNGTLDKETSVSTVYNISAIDESGAGNSTSTTFTLNLDDYDEFDPVMSGSILTGTINEGNYNVFANQIVSGILLSATDADADTNPEDITYTFALTGTDTSDDGKFRIFGNEIRAINPQDHETGGALSYDVVANSGSRTDTATVNITVGDVEEAPDVTLSMGYSPSNRLELVGGGWFINVGTFTANDPDTSDSGYGEVTVYNNGNLIDGYAVGNSVYISANVSYTETAYWYNLPPGGAELYHGFASISISVADEDFEHSSVVGFSNISTLYVSEFINGATPIILDLDGDGVELISKSESTIQFDMSNDGSLQYTGWAAADDAFLALDRNNNGKIDDLGEISFIDDFIGAETDLQGLRGFDSNGDYRLDSNDAQYNDFIIWQDLNQNGISEDNEMRSLFGAGILSISLTRTPLEGEFNSNENYISGTSEFVIIDGTTNLIGDVTLAYASSQYTSAASNDYENVTFDTSKVISALSNDSQLNIAISAFTAAQHGSVVINGDDTFTYTPDAGYSGIDYFDYISYDSNTNDNHSQARVYLTVNGSSIFTGSGESDKVDFSGESQIYTINGGLGDDTLVGGVLNDTINGEDGADSLYGGDGADIINGGIGDDYIHGGLGADIIDGGDGTDMVSYGDSNVAVNINLSTGTFTGGSAAGDIVSNIEQVYGSIYNDTLTGSVNADSLFGSVGDDILEGGAGADILSGGAGVDTISYSTSSEGVRVNLSKGSGEWGDAEGDELDNTIENVTGSAYADILYGNREDNVITGGAGNDYIYGDQGNDTIDGGVGDYDVARFNGNIADYTITDIGNGETQIVGADGTDIVKNVETLYFDDRYYEVGSVNSSPAGSLTIEGAAKEGKTLIVNNAIIDADGIGSISYQWKKDGVDISGATSHTYTLDLADVGSTISVEAYYIDGMGNSEIVTSSATATVLAIGVNSTPNGDVSISGSAIEAQMLTASNTFADADGLGIINYQWKRDGVNISGATGSTYTLTQDDVTTQITVTASYTDGGGTAESETSLATVIVMNVNNSPTGIVTITGTTAEDQVLTASNSLADADGLGAISYQWKRDGVDIGGATAGSYTLVQSDVGAVITVSVNYTDAQGTAESVISSATSIVANVNDTPTGSVTITGTAAEDQILTASNSLADSDGLGTITYQWKRDGVDIGGATAGNYTLVQADVGAVMTVSANYTDGQGTAESVTSIATSIVANVNDTPTGSMTITGTAAEAEILTASNTLADEDGLGTITYQWKRGGVDIAGATAGTYTLVTADIGTAITVSASYTDGEGTAESVLSGATALVTNVNSSPTGIVIITGTAAEDQILTASNSLADADGLGTITYQWKRDGVDIGGATAGTYTLVQSDVGAVMTVSAGYTDGQGTVENVTSSATSIVANVNDAPTGSVTIGGTTQENSVLTASNTLVDADGLGTITYQWKRDGVDIGGATASTYTLTQTDVGTQITVSANYTDGQGTVESVTSSATPAVLNVNDTPTGSVTITGTAAEAEILTAGNTLADADGLGTITYQWKRNGVNIGGAAAATYTLVAADIGTAITVSANYTDSEGTAESVLSEATALVTNVNNLPTGTVTITGTAAEDQILTAANSLADGDGLGTITYQWKRDGVDIGGATASTYTLTQTDVGTKIIVSANYTDAQGTAEAVLSTSTALVANVNDTPTGTVTITGTAAEDQILTASNSLADSDGLGTITYQWKRDGVDIADAIASTYTLVQSDVGAVMTVAAGYMDGQGTVESVTSSATSAVLNVNDIPTGSVTIGGTAQENSVLTAGHTLADEDGLGTITYQWKRNGVDIGGVTAATYTLAAADIGTAITVSASYTDGEGTAETIASSATSTVTASSAPPVVTISGTNSGTGDILNGTSGDDVIEGLGGDDTLNGNDGNDTFLYNGNDDYDKVDGGLGTDTLLGGAGDDTIGLKSITGVEAIDGGLGSNIIWLWGSTIFDFRGISISNISNIRGVAGEPDIYGNDDANIIEGGGGNNELYGEGGDDVFLYNGNDGYDRVDGGLGIDTILGGSGNDTIGFKSITDIEVIDGGLGNNIIRLYGSTIFDFRGISISNISNIRGVAGEPDIYGNDDANIIEGGGGNNDLYGEGGDDTFLYNGNDGYDNVDGGLGIDTILGGVGDDTIGLKSITNIEFIDGGLGTNIISQYQSTVLDLRGITLTNISLIKGSVNYGSIYGNDQDNVFEGNGGDESIYGEGGDDTFLFNGSPFAYGDSIYGGTGIDTILGGDGNDTIGLAAVTDVEFIDGGLGTNTINLFSGADLDFRGISISNISKIIGGSGSNIIYGSDDANVIEAATGNDNLYGEGGDDTLKGGSGTDTIDGGTGYDIAVFNGNMSAYTFTASATNPFNISGTDGSDTISNIEVLRFDDQDYVISGSGAPIILDLDGDGIELVSSLTSTVLFDQDNDGVLERTGWVGADDGLLVLDRNSDGIINDATEISFIDDLPGARTDLEGLVAFDTNGDGKLNASDAQFTDFQIWQDINQNGISETGELSTFAELGISSINLALDATGENVASTGDNTITNFASFERTDTSTGQIGDAIFRYVEYTGGNINPYAGAVDLGSVNEDNSVIITSSQLLANSSDANLDALSILTVRPVTPSQGMVIYRGNGNWYFEPATNFNGNNVELHFTVSDGTTTSLGTALIDVTAVNDAASGEVLITGTVQEDQTLTASNTLYDVEGVGNISYQWQRDGVDISGEIDTAYTLVQADVGKAITVVASYTDGTGTAESMTSPATIPVLNVNDLPSGTVSISGVAQEDQILTVSHSLVDDDGLGTFTYQWKLNGYDISGATSNTYTLTQNDVGGAITVDAIYTDLGGTLEKVESSATAIVINVNDLPSGSLTILGEGIDGAVLAQEGKFLTLSNDLIDEDGLGPVSYQWKRDGLDITNATNSAYMLVQDDVGAAISVKASYTDAQGTAESDTSTATAFIANVSFAATGSVTITGIEQEGSVLTATNDIADQDGLNTIIYQWKRNGNDIVGATANTYILAAADISTAITVSANYTDGEGTTENVLSTVTGAINAAPSGSVTISGTAQEDQILTTSNTLADADGLNTISYQWQSDGVDILNETSSTYALDQADVGSVVTVAASYTDSAGFDEYIVSAPTLAISNINDLPVGSLLITGTMLEDEILTIYEDLKDEDGIGTLNYQWRRDGVDIASATNTTYTLVQADVFTQISVEVTFADAYGQLETVTSENTSFIENIDDPTTGGVSINGIAAEDQSLTAVHSFVDEDGLGPITYQWKRDGVDIIGATNINYLLTQTDVSSVISVVATHHQYGSTYNASAATIAITNVSHAPGGSLTISGTPTETQTLTLNDNITDADGLGTRSYQWMRDGSNISGATGTTYTLVQADVLQNISVKASYTDGEGSFELKTSIATGPIANINNSPTGSVSISGTKAEGSTLTASNTLADQDGLGTISYQWKRDGLNIGPLVNTYTLDQNDVGHAFTVTASYTDGFDFFESKVSAATTNIANVNDAPTGSVTISGTKQLGKTLTASNALADEDGMGTVSYQWKRNGSNISGATGSTYTLVSSDVAKTITVKASYTDGYGTAESKTSSATTTIADDIAPTVSLSGLDTTHNGFGNSLIGTLVVTDPDDNGYGAVTASSYAIYSNGKIYSDGFAINNAINWPQENEGWWNSGYTLSKTYTTTIRVYDADNATISGTKSYTITHSITHYSPPPIVLDLDGDGVELVSMAAANISFDMDGDGDRDQTGWISADDGFLALDRNGDGIINDISEISFINDLEGATTDLEGLKAFDSNDDNVLDANDDRFNEFLVWQDANFDGVSDEIEIKTLTEIGITSIDLIGTPTYSDASVNQNVILNTTTFEWIDGSTGLVGDVKLVYDKNRYGDFAKHDYTSANIGQSITVDFLSNDNISTIENISITDYIEGPNGTVVLNDDKTFTYSANEGFSGIDYFTYNIDDSVNGVSTANVYITVGGVYEFIGTNNNDFIDFSAYTESYTIDGSLGSDIIYTGSGDDVLTGGDGRDQLYSGDGNDQIFAGAGDDYIRAGAGADIINGGDGDDTISYSESNLGITVNLSSNIASGGDAEGDVISNVEHIIGSDKVDTIIGDDADNNFYGQNNDDYIDGGLGDDILRGGSGADDIFGGAGNDQIFGDHGADTIDGGDGDDTIDGGQGDDIIYGGDGEDTIDGGQRNDTIYGGNHSDTISGGKGDDLIYGGSGGDNISGDGGDDIIHGGNGQDFIDAGNGDDTIYGGNHSDTISGGKGDDLIYGGSGGDNISGDGGDDIIHGGNGQDFIDAGNGDDTIYGGHNDDIIYGDAGDDTIDGGNAYDIAVFSGNMSDYSFVASSDNPFTITGIDGVDTISNIEVLRFDDQDYVISGNVAPVVFDLDGDAVELVSSHTSTVMFDQNNDGILDRTGWVGADDGLLVLDRNGDGIINNGSEISFIDDLVGATTDMEGLVAYDTNGDNIFDAHDDMFGSFQIWQDRNQNGISEADELSSLSERNITAINLELTSTGEDIYSTGDNAIVNIAEYINDNGTTGIIGDTVLRFDPAKTPQSTFNDNISNFDARKTIAKSGSLTPLIEDAVSYQSVHVLREAISSFGASSSSVGNLGDREIDRRPNYWHAAGTSHMKHSM